VLIVPSYQAGNELRESLARNASGIVNLCAETLDGLARKAAEAFIAQNGLSLLSSSQAAVAFENVYHDATRSNAPASSKRRDKSGYAPDRRFLSFSGGKQAPTEARTLDRRLEEQGSLLYFSRKGTSDGLVSAIAAAILELRYCGITGAGIDSGSFVSPDKGQDIKELLCAYECYLQVRNYIDPPGLLSIAMEQPADHEDAFYLIPPFLRLNPLEREFIKTRIPAEKLFVLQSEPIPGMSPPPGTLAELFPERLVDCREDEHLAKDVGPFTGIIKPGISRERLEDHYTWQPGDVQIIDPREAKDRLAPDPGRDNVDQEDAIPDDDDLMLFHAYGLTNEAREVLRRVIAMQAPLDTVTVAYAGPEYIQVFNSLCKRSGFGLTLADGLPASLTRPGNALKGIIEWMKGGFATIAFRQLLIEGSIRLRLDKGDSDLPPLEAAEILRDLGIGWGMERYSRLASFSEGIRGELEGVDESSQTYASLLGRVGLASQFDEIMQNIMALVPKPDGSGSIKFGDFAAAMASILARLARVADDMDAQAIQALLVRLGEIGQSSSFSLGYEYALDRISDIVDALSVGASSSRPGALHLVSYRSLYWTGRPNTFVVGLDATSFPGGVAQNPVLLDSERESLHQELPLGRDQPKVAMSEMLTALSSLRGRISLSYPSFDVVESREKLPSPLLLQAFRSLRGDPSLDYSNLMNFLGNPAGYCPLDPRQAIDETEWWIGQALAGRLVNGHDLVRQCYRSIDRGQVAFSARQVGAPTEYDGIVAAYGSALSQRRSHATMSCSRIEYLAGCPFAYFLKYVLYLNPHEEVAYDPGRWLDPMERGLLLHELYCNFMKEIVKRNQHVSVAAHKDLMYKMADELIGRYRLAAPPPSEVVFNREVRDIRDSCDVFLATEESEIESTPIFFEVPFGLPGEVHGSDLGAVDPVRIDLGQGLPFYLRGQIDRIDSIGQDIYRIWDYKTGSPRGYDDHRYLCGGRQVQHALYAIAAEKILRDRLGCDPRVESAVYYFPTKRGEGRRVVRPESDRSLITNLMGHLFGILESGAFLATDDREACGYCDYAEVCDREQAVSRAKALVSDTANTCLDPWRRLKDFE
jgi:ATP-dependent helicase/nuclease subunit B